MNSKNLLARLDDLENALHEFSYQKLTAAEAQELKDSLTSFRRHIESKIPKEAPELTEVPEKTVLKVNEENNAAVVKSPEAAVRPEAVTPLPDSSRFSEYVKDSPLSKEQLDYINSILAASDIPTRISNDFPQPSKRKLEKNSEKRNHNNSIKSKPMESANKTTSEAVEHSKMSKSKAVEIDLGPVLEECLGKKELLEELIRLYKQNALEFIGQLKIHIQNIDFESIRFAAHKIKSGLRMMDTQELLTIAEQIETASKTDQDLKHLEFLFACFVKEYPIVERAIDAAFKELS
ncbi:MAG: Hpt domain-containing protein [Flavobacteriaceae bacterium]